MSKKPTEEYKLTFRKFLSVALKGNNRSQTIKHSGFIISIHGLSYLYLRLILVIVNSRPYIDHDVVILSSVRGHRKILSGNPIYRYR